MCDDATEMILYDNITKWNVFVTKYKRKWCKSGVMSCLQYVQMINVEI